MKQPSGSNSSHTSITIIQRRGSHEPHFRMSAMSLNRRSVLARAYTGAGNEARATAVLQRAVQLQPANSRLATELALSRARRGQMETALSDLSTVFTRDNFGEVAGMPLATLYLNRH